MSAAGHRVQAIEDRDLLGQDELRPAAVGDEFERLE